MKKAVKLYHVDSSDSIIHILHLTKESLERQGEIPPYHYHDVYELTIVKKGSVEFIMNHSIRRIESGEIIFLGNESPHEMLNYSDDFEVYIIHISKMIFSWEMDKFPEINTEVQFLREGRFCYMLRDEQLASSLLKLVDKINCLQGIMKLCAVFEIIYILAHSPKDEVLEGESKVNHFHKGYDTSIEKAYRYIYSHFMENITLEQIAFYANQNQTALCRSFKRVSKITIFEFINKLRIEKACILLRSSSMSINQIAYYVGYNCFSNFSIKFKAIIKTSPTQYRAANVSNNLSIIL